MKLHTLTFRCVIWALLGSLSLALAGCSELYTLRQINADQEQRIAGIERKLKEKDDALKRLNLKSDADINTLNKELRQAQEERQKAIADSSQREEQLAAASAKAKKDIEALQYDREGYKTLSEKLQASVETLTKDLGTRQGELEASRKEMAALKETLKKKTDDAAALDSQLKAATAESAQRADAISKAQKDLSEIQGKVKKLEDDNQALLSTVSDQKKLLEATKSESERTKEIVASLEAAKQRLESGAASSAPRVASGPTGDLKAAFLLLEPSFKALPPDQAQYASVTQDGRGVVVRLSADFLFKTRSVQLNPAAYPMLDHVAEIFKKYPRQYVDVQGHTDNRPLDELPFEDNWGLASERANKVLRYLTENGQIEPGRIHSSSYSSSRPLPKEGGNPALDRRVEIILTPNP